LTPSRSLDSRKFLKKDLPTASGSPASHPEPKSLRNAAKTEKESWLEAKEGKDQIFDKLLLLII
jgi:hypothetical protein